MKKLILSSLLVLALAGNCAILNPLGLSVDREKGSDAKDRISTAALTNDLLISQGTPSYSGKGILSLLAPELAGVDDSKYYIKGSVDECVEAIETIGLVAAAVGSQVRSKVLAAIAEGDFAAALAAANQFTPINDLRLITPATSCDLKEDGIIFGDPLPKL